MKQLLIWNRRGNGLVEIETYYDRRNRTYRSTGIKCEHWDPYRRKAFGPGSEEINRRLGEILSGHESSPAPSLSPSTPLVPWMTAKILSRRTSEGTKESQLCALNCVKDFDGSADIEDITPAWLATWSSWMAGRGLSPMSAQVYHQTLRCYLNIAVREGVIDKSPYDRYRPERVQRPERHALSSAQLDQIRQLPLTRGLAKARDLFLLMALTGMAYTDCQRMDPGKIKKGWYEGHRVKTGARFLAPVNAEARAIIGKYGGVPKAYITGFDIHLNKIGEMIGLPWRLTSHVARHTFITLSLEKGVAPAVVQRMAGHASITMTETYMHPDDNFIKSGAQALF